MRREERIGLRVEESVDNSLESCVCFLGEDIVGRSVGRGRRKRQDGRGGE